MPAGMPEHVKTAKENGIMDGTRPRDFITREEVGIVGNAILRKALDK